MDHAAIPSPARFAAGGGPGFAVRPGTLVSYADTPIAPIAGRFCAQIARRTGRRLTPVHGDTAPAEPSVTIELAAAREPAGLPAPAGLREPAGLPVPAGLSPGGGDPPDERYSLVVEDGRVLL